MYFVFAHEFGHLFDFANGVNRFEWNQACSQAGTCASSVGSWSSIAWETSTTHLTTTDFKDSSLLCFYGCQKTMTQDQAIELYQDFQHGGFVSTYASTNPWDDFAETLAYYVLRTTMKKSLVVTYADGLSFDATDRLDTPELKKKVGYVQGFLAASPKYP
jgi:hypothetical protein